MKCVAALVLALSLPACASAAAPSPWSPSSVPAPLAALQGVDDGVRGSEKKGEWYPHSPTGKKEFNREGPYIGISAIGSFEQFDSPDPTVTFDDSTAGLGLRFGYRTWANLAVELVAEDSFDFKATTPLGETKFDIFNVGLQGKYFLLTEAFQPYALLGAGWTQVDEQSGGALDDNGAYVRIGAGFELYITRDVALFGEGHLNRTLGGVKDFDHIDIQAGFIFRF
jgi:hypothetical protein